jgi:3-dehydroquinate dehydratase-2
MKSIRVIHGPNLNLLGQRDHVHYGTLTLSDINLNIQTHAKKNNIACDIFQCNAESDIINLIHQAGDVLGIVLNPAAYTHTSVAIRDAIDAIAAPVIEVHLSNVHAREKFRHTSLCAPVCKGQILGLGWHGYILAIDYLIHAG